MSENNKHTIEADFVSITQPETYGNFTKQEMTVKIIDGQYTNWAVFDVSGKTMELLQQNPLSEGDKLNISFAVSGRFNNRYNKVFNGLRAYFVRNLSKSSSQPQSQDQQQSPASQQPAQTPPPMPSFEDSNDEAVPF